MITLGNRLLMAGVGDSGDTVQFAEYIAKNIQLYRMKNGTRINFFSVVKCIIYCMFLLHV